VEHKGTVTREKLPYIITEEMGHGAAEFVT
jgi:hypothetical protein